MAKKKTLPDDFWGGPDTEPIEEPPHYLRAWRKFRRLTQRQLADAVGTSESVISELERMEKAMSLKWLYRLAKALNTKPGFIVEHDPASLPTDVLEIWSDIPEANRKQAIAVLQTFKKDGTNG